jgi:CheY-like chemotaxis protein
VHGIIHNHGGRLQVESRLGQGTTFTLTFPQDGGTLLPARLPALEPVGALNQVRILVAEDEAYLRETLEEALAAVGATVVGAANGTEAWERFGQQPFDCVLSDQRMPGCTGMELLERVRTAGFTLPFILASGQDLEPFQDELARDPAFRLLAKPFSITTLVDLIKACQPT